MPTHRLLDAIAHDLSADLVAVRHSRPGAHDGFVLCAAPAVALREGEPWPVGIPLGNGPHLSS